jgi:hypothetical protein
MNPQTILCGIKTTLGMIELVYTNSIKAIRMTENTHVVFRSVPLPRRNDPILELFEICHSGGEELLEIRYRPSQRTILTVELLQIGIHRHRN